MASVTYKIPTEKILIMVITGILLVAIVAAWEEGQEFSQAQVDGVDVDTLTWQDLSCQKDGWRILDKTVYVDYSCLSLKKIDETYTVIRKETSYGIYIPYAVACIVEYGAETCRDRYRVSFREDVKELVKRIKEHIRSFQTADGFDIGAWFDNWGLGD